MHFGGKMEPIFLCIGIKGEQGEGKRMDEEKLLFL